MDESSSFVVVGSVSNFTWRGYKEIPTWLGPQLQLDRGTSVAVPREWLY